MQPHKTSFKTANGHSITCNLSTQINSSTWTDHTFSLIRVLQASFLLGRWSMVPATGTPVAATGGLLTSGCLICCLEAMSSSSLSYSGGLFAALTTRANKNSSACNSCRIIIKTPFSHHKTWPLLLNNELVSNIRIWNHQNGGELEIT